MYNLDARLTGAQAASVAGVSRQLVYWWRTAGKLTPDAAGRYRLGDVLELELAMRDNPRSSRYQPA